MEYEYDTRLGRVNKRIVYDTYYGYVSGNKPNSTTDRLSSIQNQDEPIAMNMMQRAI